MKFFIFMDFIIGLFKFFKDLINTNVESQAEAQTFFSNSRAHLI